MNAEFVGNWDVAPRAHPNDGMLDVISVPRSFGIGDRMKARSRLPHGGHLPHPGISVERTAACRATFAPGLRVHLDGAPLVGVAHEVSVQLEPDTLVCVV